MHAGRRQVHRWDNNIARYSVCSRVFSAPQCNAATITLADAPTKIRERRREFWKEISRLSLRRAYTCARHIKIFFNTQYRKRCIRPADVRIVIVNDRQSLPRGNDLRCREELKAISATRCQCKYLAQHLNESAHNQQLNFISYLYESCIFKSTRLLLVKMCHCIYLHESYAHWLGKSVLRLYYSRNTDTVASNF